MISLVNVAKDYDKLRVLKKITLDIPTGAIFGVIGRSGAGKSTLLRLMSLLETPSGGMIYIDGDRVDDLTGAALLSRRRRHGMIFQNFNLFYSRNVSGNIAYPLEIVGANKSDIRKRVGYLLELVELGDKAASPISKLSGGQKQRVAIARALAASPEILFCDEATSALDPQTTVSILSLIKEIREKLGITIVLITHQMEVARLICDYVTVLSQGEVAETGSARELFTRPKSTVTRELLITLRQTDREIFGNEFLKADTLAKPNTVCVYRLLFNEDNTIKPIVSRLIKRFSLEVNILGAAFNILDKDYVGEMHVSITGETKELERAKEYLRGEGVALEEVEIFTREKPSC